MSPRPPASERLDRGQILNGALALADRDGIDAVSLRKIAAELKVTPMALYWHFKDKDALLDALVERMLAEVSAPEGDLRTITAEVLRVLRAHPALAEITPIRFMRTDTGIAIGERILGLLHAAGHTPEAAAQLTGMMLNSLAGLVIGRPGELVIHDAATREALLTAKRGRLKSLPPETFPHLTEAADFYLHLPDEEAYYRRGLDFALAFA